MVEEFEVVVEGRDLVVFGLVLVFETEGVVVEELQFAVYLFVSHHKINNKNHRIRSQYQSKKNNISKSSF